MARQRSVPTGVAADAYNRQGRPSVGARSILRAGLVLPEFCSAEYLDSTGYDFGMAVVLQPWQIFVATMPGWIARQQDSVAGCSASIAALLGSRFTRYSEPQHRSAQFSDSTPFS